MGIKKVLSLYARERMPTRLHVAARCGMVPFDILERLMPRAGAIADLGCGHGIFSNLLAIGSPQREVIGIDRDGKKIAIATRTIGEKRNLGFQVGDLSRFPPGAFSGIVILGVLYHLPYDRQRAILAHCMRNLSPGGVLLVGTVDTSQRLRFWKSRIMEYIANLALRAIGAQSGSVSLRLHHLRKEEWVDLLCAMGFSVQEVGLPLPVPENIFLCRKPQISP